jgi:hypothetical protein
LKINVSPQEKIMQDLISGVISKIGSLFKSLQIKQLISVVLVGLLMIATNVDALMSKQDATKKVDQMLQNDDSIRPKTTGEWQQQAREVKGKPGERAKRIGEQSAEAVKDFGSLYPDVAKRSGEELKNSD